jgi:transcription elongation factor GreA
MNNTEQVPITPEGYKKLKNELKNLKTFERPKIIEAIAEARAHGDLKENAEYSAAKEKQGFIEARIAELDDKLSRAQIISQPPSNPNIIRFGAWVTLYDEETMEEKKYHIVGDLEADITKNKLSISSPLSKAIIGKSIDDIIEFKAPKGIVEYSIIKIEY